MADKQEYEAKVKELFDNIECLVKGEKRLFKELYNFISWGYDGGDIDRACINVSADDRSGLSKYQLSGYIIRSIVIHYPSLRVEISSPLGLTSVDVFIKDLYKVNENLPLANESIPTTERRSIMIIPDDAKPKLAGVSTYTMSKALELFKFPPNHPEKYSAYAMIDVYPDFYLPLASFHEHYKQTKHAAFIELCANLGAKEICIESAEINEQTLDASADIKTPLAKLGLGINVKENHETGQKIAFKFSEENRKIKDYDSPWLYTEPSWMSMNNLRRNNHLTKLGAEFTCLDDMGINATLISKMKGVGVNIGGSFKEMTKIRLSYSVIFWE